MSAWNCVCRIIDRILSLYLTWLGFRCWQTTPGPGVYCAVPIRMQQNRANRALNVSKYLPASIYAVGDIRIQIKSQFYCWTNSRPSNDGLWQPMDQSAKSQIHLFSPLKASLKIYLEMSFEIFKIRLKEESDKSKIRSLWSLENCHSLKSFDKKCCRTVIFMVRLFLRKLIC